MGRVIRGLSVVAALSMLPAGGWETAGHAAVILDSLVIRIYDNSGVLAAERTTAIKQAQSILGRAEVGVEWLECPARGITRQKARCAVPVAPRELVVRLTDVPPSLAPGQDLWLGYAHIDEESGRGTLATVFVNRITDLAQRTRSERAPLLGRAMAHEIGHLLLGTNAHSTTGLMREVWAPHELSRNRADDWTFSPTQRDQMQQTLLGRAPQPRTSGRREG